MSALCEDCVVLDSESCVTTFLSPMSGCEVCVFPVSCVATCRESVSSDGCVLVCVSVTK